MAVGRYAGAVELAYTAVGDASGAPVVLLPGLTASRASWGDVVRELPPDAHVYSIDLRGHGQSGRGLPDTYVLDRYVADAIGFCVDVVKSPVALVGHSLGGVIAFEVARLRPGLVRGVVMIDPPLYRESGDRRFTPPFHQLRELLRDLHSRHAGVDEYESVFGALPFPGHSLTAAEVLTQEGLREFALAMVALDPDVLTPAIDGTLFIGADPDAALGRPLLVLRADPNTGSAVFTEADAVRLRRNNPAALVETLQGSGHAALTDAAREVCEHIIRFLPACR